MKIYLVGYMGSGKSTTGAKLASLLNMEHVDLDWLFEETYKISIVDFFNKYDEKAFRLIEHQLVQKTASLDGYVISTGGGTPCFHGNMELINTFGLSVYLRMSPEALFVRLKNSKRPRPLTHLLSDDNLHQRIIDDMAHREKFYQMAAIVTNGENPDIEMLAGEIKSRMSGGGE